GFEPEDESPIVFLRLRKAARKQGTKVFGIASHETRGLKKMLGTMIEAVPGDEPRILADLETDNRLALGAESVILVGERLAESPGGLSAALELSRRTGAKLAWVPRRAGERPALDAGCLP